MKVRHTYDGILAAIRNIRFIYICQVEDVLVP